MERGMFLGMSIDRWDCPVAALSGSAIVVGLGMGKNQTGAAEA